MSARDIGRIHTPDLNFSESRPPTRRLHKNTTNHLSHCVNTISVSPNLGNIRSIFNRFPSCSIVGILKRVGETGGFTNLDLGHIVTIRDIISETNLTITSIPRSPEMDAIVKNPIKQTADSITATKATCSVANQCPIAVVHCGL